MKTAREFFDQIQGTICRCNDYLQDADDCPTCLIALYEARDREVRQEYAEIREREYKAQVANVKREVAERVRDACLYPPIKRVPCRTCGAQIGIPCWDGVNNHPAAGTHHTRVADAIRALDLEEVLK